MKRTQGEIQAAGYLAEGLLQTWRVDQELYAPDRFPITATFVEEVLGQASLISDPTEFCFAWGKGEFVADCAGKEYKLEDIVAVLFSLRKEQLKAIDQDCDCGYDLSDCWRFTFEEQVDPLQEAKDLIKDYYAKVKP